MTTSTTKPTHENNTMPMRMTWYAFASLYARLAESGEARAVRGLAPDMRRMGRMADALVAIEGSLTAQQRADVGRILRAV